MSDATPTEDEPEAPAIVDGVEVAYVDPEPDEVTGGDTIEFVETGWIRFRIGDERIRFRPARVGELRRLMEALDSLNDELVERSEEAQDEAEAIDAAQEAIDASDVSDRDKARGRRANTAKAMEIAKQLTRWSEEQRLVWWRLAHETLGVGDEALPPDDECPVWLLSPTLINMASGHWRTVPLDRGRRPARKV